MLKILIDVAEGMQFLHSAQVLHGDLKPANVLLKSGPGSHVVTAVVADFGLSRMLDASLSQNSIQRTSSMGTIQYMAPELLSHGRLSKAADVWAFGILMVELWSGDTVFGDMSAAAIYFSLVQNGEVPKVPGHCPPRYAAAVARCLAIDPEARWDFGSIVEELRGMGGDVGLA